MWSILNALLRRKTPDIQLRETNDTPKPNPEPTPEPSPEAELRAALQNYGLDPSYWEGKLSEALGIKSVGAFKHTQSTDIEKLKSALQDRPTWEKQALISLLTQSKNADESSKDKKKQQLEETKDKLTAVLTDIKALAEKEGQKSGDIMKLLEQALAMPELKPSLLDDNLNIKYASMTADDTTVAISRENLQPNSLLSYIYGGSALQGIYPLEDVVSMSPIRDNLIDIFHFKLRGAQRTAHFYQTSFSDCASEWKFTKQIEKHGWNASASLSVGFGGFAISTGASKAKDDDHEEDSQTQSSESYQSSIRYCLMPMATSYIETNMMTLSPEARSELARIYSIADVAEKAEICEQFFRRFGSHANQGPLVLGGKYTWKASVKGFEEKEKDTVQDMVTSALNIHAGASYGPFSAGASYGNTDVHGQLKADGFDKLRSKIELSIDKVGGAPECDGLQQWKTSLANSNSTWSIIQTGYNLVPIWEILLTNNKEEKQLAITNINVQQLCTFLKQTYEDLSKKKKSDSSVIPKPLITEPCVYLGETKLTTPKLLSAHVTCFLPQGWKSNGGVLLTTSEEDIFGGIPEHSNLAGRIGNLDVTDHSMDTVLTFDNIKFNGSLSKDQKQLTLTGKQGVALLQLLQ